MLLQDLKLQNKRARRKKGQVLTSLILVMALFVVGSLGLLAFEISRYALAKQQLSTCVQSAALAGAATMAMYAGGIETKTVINGVLTGLGNSAGAAVDTQTSAKQMFLMNTILGAPIKGLMVEYNTGSVNNMGNPPGQEAYMAIQTMTEDESTANIPSNVITSGVGSLTASQESYGTASLTQNAAGKIIKIGVTYGVVPAFGKYLNFGTVPVTEIALSGVPEIDVVTCFDNGGGMDDTTNVSFVKRWYDTNKAETMYTIATQPPGSPNPGQPAEGTIASLLCTTNQPMGSSVNIMPPLGLESANTSSCKMYFSEYPTAGQTDGSTAATTTAGLAGSAYYGQPPGNYPGAGGVTPTPSKGSAYVFTDVVANLDGNAKFVKGTYKSPGGYSYPSVGTMVEAARGNLESATAAKHAGMTMSGGAIVTPTTLAGVIPQAGYESDYTSTALSLAVPSQTCNNAAFTFNGSLRESANAAVGVVAYCNRTTAATTPPAVTNSTSVSAGIGSEPFCYISMPNVSQSYSQAQGSQSVSQNGAAGNTDYGSFLLTYAPPQQIPDWEFNLYKSTCTSPQASVSSQPAGSTLWNSLDSALIQATSDLTNPMYHRANASRAIVVFTNSTPDQSNTANWQSIRSAAQSAGAAGIPIYCVALDNSNGTMTTLENSLYNDQDPSSSGGICGIAGHGGMFIPIHNNNQVTNAMGNVMRQLIKLSYATP